MTFYTGRKLCERHTFCIFFQKRNETRHSKLTHAMKKTMILYSLNEVQTYHVRNIKGKSFYIDNYNLSWMWPVAILYATSPHAKEHLR